MPLFFFKVDGFNLDFTIKIRLFWDVLGKIRHFMPNLHKPANYLFFYAVLNYLCSQIT